MKSQNRTFRIALALASLGAFALVGANCSVESNTKLEPSESSAPAEAAARAARTEAAAGHAQQELPAAVCVTIQRGTFGNVYDTEIASTADSKHPSGNFGANLVMIGGQVQSGSLRQALIEWDLSSLPPNLGITSATATLLASSDSLGGAGITLSVHAVTSAWDENTVTWATAPSWNPAAAASDSGGPGTHTFDLTSLAQGWATGSNNGIMLTQSPFYYANFATSEAVIASQRPALQVCYIPDLCHGVTCNGSDQCHVGSCDANTGACLNNAVANGTACNDGNPSTTNDICTNGTCAGTAPAAQCVRVGWKYGYSNWACPAGYRMPTASEYSLVSPCITAQDQSMMGYYDSVAIDVGGCNCKWNSGWCGYPSIDTFNGRACGDFEQLQICVN